SPGRLVLQPRAGGAPPLTAPRCVACLLIIFLGLGLFLRLSPRPLFLRDAFADLAGGCVREPGIAYSVFFRGCSLFFSCLFFRLRFFLATLLPFRHLP